MKRLHVESAGTTEATPSEVWPLVADAGKYSEWGHWSASGCSNPGEAANGSVGSVRWLRYGFTTTVEKVLEAEPGHRLVYTVVGGLPVRNYRATVTLTVVGGSTAIHWEADWDRTIRGLCVFPTLRWIYPRVVASLVAAANSLAAERLPGA